MFVPQISVIYNYADSQSCGLSLYMNNCETDPVHFLMALLQQIFLVNCVSSHFLFIFPLAWQISSLRLFCCSLLLWGSGGFVIVLRLLGFLFCFLLFFPTSAVFLLRKPSTPETSLCFPSQRIFVPFFYCFIRSSLLQQAQRAVLM